MNMIENLQFSFGFLIVWVIAYVVVREWRPHAHRSQEVAIDLVSGSAINSLFWLLILVLSTSLQNSSESFVKIINLVLETRIMLVPWAFLSYGLVSFGFQLDRRSNGHVDWRAAMTLSAILSTAMFGIYYYFTGIPTSPFGIPW